MIKGFFVFIIISFSYSQPDVIRFVKDVWPENACAVNGSANQHRMVVILFQDVRVIVLG